jgi:polysaccharide biosynthesis PFTS motif protein
LDRNVLSRIYVGILKRTWAQSANSLNLLEWKRSTFDSQIWQEFLSSTLTDKYLITTQSSEFKLPPAFISANNTRVSKIMLWYGTNTEPLEPTINSAKTHSNYFELNNYIDKHYVWDDFQSNLLESKGITNREVKGSMVFIPRDISLIRLNFPTIVYFDVTPQFRTNSSYTEQFCTSTLLEIISACDEISKLIGKKITLLVKPKRKYYKIHSKKYLHLLKELRINEKIEIVDPATNVYDLIASADITLGIIYTSPVLIAKELKKPGFFVGFNKVQIMDNYNGVKVVGHSAELRKIISSTLNFKS